MSACQNISWSYNVIVSSVKEVSILTLDFINSPNVHTFQYNAGRYFYRYFVSKDGIVIYKHVTNSPDQWRLYKCSVEDKTSELYGFVQPLMVMRA